MQKKLIPRLHDEAYMEQTKKNKHETNLEHTSCTFF